MKRLLYLLFSGLAFHAGHAQNKQTSLPKLREKLTALQNLKQHSRQAATEDTTKEFLNLSPYLKSPRPGVHRLPLDNMPSLVPDPTESVAITNLWKGDTQVPFRSRTQPIPNPARPKLQVRPSRPLLLTPETK